MNEEIMIRETEQDDLRSLKILYREAFAEKDLFPLVREQVNDTGDTLHLSAVKGDVLVGHIAFTCCQDL